MSERLKVNSRVRVASVTIRASYDRHERRRFLKWLDATGTVVNFDPRWRLPWYVRLDNGDFARLAEDNLEVLELCTGASVLQPLVEAIGRHPAAEDDPAVIDAINAVEEELQIAGWRVAYDLEERQKEADDAS